MKPIAGLVAFALALVFFSAPVVIAIACIVLLITGSSREARRRMANLAEDAHQDYTSFDEDKVATPITITRDHPLQVIGGPRRGPDLPEAHR